MLKFALLHFLRNFLQLILLRYLLVDNVEPAQPLVFIAPRPKRSVTLPQTLHVSARLPLGDRRFHGRSKRFRQGGLQSAHGYPFCCVFFFTASSSLSKASAKSFTPSWVNLSVTSLIEMPTCDRSLITLAAAGTSSVRLFLSFP